MKVPVDVCDWCKNDNAVVRVIDGHRKGDVLCKKCSTRFLKLLEYEYFQRIDIGDIIKLDYGNDENKLGQTDAGRPK